VELTREEYLHRLRITPQELISWLEHELVAPLPGSPSAAAPRFAESAIEEGELIRKFTALGYSLPEIQKIKRSVGLPVRDEAGRYVSRSDLLTIGELAERSGINVRTIKFWEEKGLVAPHRRTEGGFRLYRPADVVLLSFIKDLQAFNYTLAEIGTILELAGPDLGVTDEDLAQRPIAELEKTAAALEFLVERMREMREASVRVETVFSRRLRAVAKAIRTRKRP
jgi:DNA-binding transcriptional MerR regulator